MNYRSAVVHGRARLVTDDAERLAALRAVTEHVAPGSWDHARPPTRKELAATAVLALDLAEASVKVRTGPPVDDDEDVAAGGRWAGVVPIRTVVDAPQPCTLLPPGTPTPPTCCPLTWSRHARASRTWPRTFGVTVDGPERDIRAPSVPTRADRPHTRGALRRTSRLAGELPSSHVTAAPAYPRGRAPGPRRPPARPRRRRPVPLAGGPGRPAHPGRGRPRRTRWPAPTSTPCPAATASPRPSARSPRRAGWGCRSGGPGGASRPAASRARSTASCTSPSPTAAPSGCCSTPPRSTPPA